MASVVDICNMALSRIGNSQRINALDEASIQAEQCSLFYEPSRDFVLADYPWPFAMAYVSLAEVVDNPNPEFPHSYSVPTDCLRARRIVNGIFPDGAWPYCVNRPEIPQTPYRIINGASGRVLSTIVNPATLEYTAKVTSPELFDPIFVSALAWKLAGQIAPAIAKDAGAAQSCEGMYRAEMAQAFAGAENESAQDYRRESSFITGRC